MVNTFYYRKIFWLLKREFPSWLVNWNYLWTAGNIIIGEEFEFCLATDLTAIIADKTSISYDDRVFFELLKDYYREPGEDAFDTVNKLYRLRLLIKAAEKQQTVDAVKEALSKLIEETEHLVCKSFLIKVFALHHEKNGQADAAFQLLATIPHERRRSFAFLIKVCDPINVFKGADYFYTCLEMITHPVERELALKIEYEWLARSERWEEAYVSFIKSLANRNLYYDYQHFIKLLLNAGEKKFIHRILDFYLERLEKTGDHESSDESMKTLFEELQAKGYGAYVEKIKQLSG